MPQLRAFMYSSYAPDSCSGTSAILYVQVRLDLIGIVAVGQVLYVRITRSGCHMLGLDGKQLYFKVPLWLNNVIGRGCFVTTSPIAAHRRLPSG